MDRPFDRRIKGIWRNLGGGILVYYSLAAMRASLRIARNMFITFGATHALIISRTANILQFYLFPN